jgi:hypothetical protein
MRFAEIIVASREPGRQPLYANESRKLVRFTERLKNARILARFLGKSDVGYPKLPAQSRRSINQLDLGIT